MDTVYEKMTGLLVEVWKHHAGMWYDDDHDDQDHARKLVKRRRFQHPDDPLPSQLLKGEELQQYHKDANEHYARRTKRREAAIRGRENRSFKDHLKAIAAGGKDTPKTEYEKKHTSTPEEAKERRESRKPVKHVGNPYGTR